jgi:hypothetical protein
MHTHWILYALMDSLVHALFHALPNVKNAPL